MGVANSLMLDFRCLVVPRFIYALGDSFQANELIDPQIEERINELAEEIVRLKSAMTS